MYEDKPKSRTARCLRLDNHDSITGVEALSSVDFVLEDTEGSNCYGKVSGGLIWL